MPYDRIKVGQAIRSRRMARNLTQNELAMASGISIRSIQRIESGEVAARAYTLGVLQQILDLDLEGSYIGIRDNGSASADTRNCSARRPRRLLYSSALALACFLSSGFFLTTSAAFPETHFELYAFLTLNFAAYAIVLRYACKAD